MHGKHEVEKSEFRENPVEAKEQGLKLVRFSRSSIAPPKIAPTLTLRAGCLPSGD